MNDLNPIAASHQYLKDKVILQVIPTLETGGAERTTIDVVRGIHKVGGKALVASAGGRLLGELEAAGGIHRKLPLDAKFRLDQLWRNKHRLMSLCREFKVDLIHTRSRAPAFSALSAARALGLPFLTTYHGIYSERTAVKRWYNSVMVAGDAVIANSNYTRDLIIERYQTPIDKLHVIHRGTDMNRFDPERISKADRQAFGAQWRIPAGRPVVMLVARLTDWKGHLLAIKAASHLKAEIGSHPFFVFVGRAQSETYAARIRSAIVEAGLLDDVALVGHADNVPLALSLADIVIVPSTKPEAFGRSVAEASAMGIPAIAFDHGGATETIACPPSVPEQERTGYRVPVGDITALANAIGSLLQLSKKDRSAICKRARHHIAKHFSTEQMVGKTLMVYANILTKFR